jgi:diguanylate cyclase (GGDEF)-like protein
MLSPVMERDERLDPRAEAELRRLAYRDHLTGLPNRIAMADRIEAALARSRREGLSTAVLFLDMDGFKRVNDTLGHPAGDELLALLAERLRTLGDIRVTAGRYGGDEFLLLVDDLPYDHDEVVSTLRGTAERLFTALRDPFTVRRSSFEITASVGASVFPVDAATHSELIEHADQAMYIAKRRGGNQLAIFDSPESHSLLELEASLPWPPASSSSATSR